jgi:hypothetical protein
MSTKIKGQESTVVVQQLDVEKISDDETIETRPYTPKEAKRVLRKIDMALMVRPRLPSRRPPLGSRPDY